MFAQDQVAELPPPADPAPLDPPIAEIRGDSHADRLADLERLVAEIGYRMRIADTGHGRGQSTTATRS